MRFRDKYRINTTNPSPGELMESDAHSSHENLGPPSRQSQIGHFIWHFVQMCMACCIGGVTLSVLFFGGAALVGYTDLTQRLPELSTLLIALFLALPMAAWMRFRGMQWRPSLEMAVTPIVVGIVLIGLSSLGIIARSSLIEWLTGLACPVMLIPMLLRLDLYAGRSGHQMQMA